MVEAEETSVPSTEGAFNDLRNPDLLCAQTERDNIDLPIEMAADISEEVDGLGGKLL